jgi:hypothetical protein
MAAAAAILLTILFVVRPGGARLKTRITNAISRAVARPADIGSVQIRFLPRPGFDLENLVIYEDPAFGAEPMLRAGEVTAAVRLSSLLRGKIEVSRLELTEPSLNLVRRSDGQWNWEALLERTSQTPLAPTAKSKSEPRPAFPYIEASSGRINFKSGAEKLPYALLNADFAVWQESENSWGVRLRAEPLRTDMSLSDTGLLQMSGTWQRAGSLRETPLQLDMEWQHAQMGQFTKLFSGADKGWRGEIALQAHLIGRPAALAVTTDASLRDFHRYDIPSSEGLGLAAHCEGTYDSAAATMRDIVCAIPVGAGAVDMRGRASAPSLHKLDLAIEAENIPVSSIAQLARRAKKDLPSDILAAGSLRGSFTVKQDGAGHAATFQGKGEFSNLRLQSTASKAELASSTIPFVLKPVPAVGGMRMEFGPFPLGLGRASPAQASGWLGRGGYMVTVRGEGEISHALRMATLFGLQASRGNIEGAAQLDLQIAGPWSENASSSPSGFSLPQVNGIVQWHNAKASFAGLKRPIEISSAKLRLTPQSARMEDISAQAADARWTGWVELPRGCGSPGACLTKFSLHSQEVGLGDLHNLLHPPAGERRWYQVLPPDQPQPPAIVLNLRATGTVKADRLRVRGAVAEKVSAAVEFDRGTLAISNLRADWLGGKHRGDWRIDYTGSSPVYSGSGTLSAISLNLLADAMHDPWITGVASGNYEIQSSEVPGKAFWQSAQGTLGFDLHECVLSRISLTDGQLPLQIKLWRGQAQLRDGKIELQNSQLLSQSGAYRVEGSAALNRSLDFKLTATQAGAGSLVYRVTGTLAEPKVEAAPSPDTRAQLKP